MVFAPASLFYLTPFCPLFGRYINKEGLVKINKLWAVLGIVLFVVGVFDISFYWPVNGEIWVFLIKKIFYIAIGTSLIWEHLIKPIYVNSHGAN